MVRTITRLALLSGLLLSVGCAMASSDYDYNYNAYGGRWQRDDPVHGRVGSAFTPSGGAVILDPQPAAAPEPTEAQPQDVDARVEQSSLR